MTKGSAIGVLHPRPSLPIVRVLAAQPDAVDRDRIEQLVDRLRAAEPALAAPAVFGPDVAAGIGPGPALLIEDHSAIALAPKCADSRLEYRILFLAGDGDMAVVGRARDTVFEAFCFDLLGLKRVDVMHPLGKAQTPLALRCARDPAIMKRVVERARRAGGLNVLPYMGSGHVWQLAHAIADEAGLPVWVAAPPPRLMQRVNDKLWFARLVADLLGPRALPPTYEAHGPTALAGRVAALTRHNDRVVVKLPDSSGAAGNLVLDAAPLRGLSPTALRDRLVALTRSLGWADRFPVAVGVWEIPVVDSPSVQMWIPDGKDGPPVVQGVFSQVVGGDVGEFVGAAPCALPECWRHRLAREAVTIGAVFQGLGYFGACALDALITGDRLETAELRWIECNGRWGGVSLPLVLADRLAGDGRRLAVVVMQKTRDEPGPGHSFDAVLEALRGHIYHPDVGRSGVVPLTPACFADGTGIHLITLADSVDAARREAERAEALLEK